MIGLKRSELEAEFKGDVVRQTISVGLMQCNCTIIGNTKTKEAIVVDAGGDASLVHNTANKLGLEVSLFIH